MALIAATAPLLQACQPPPVVVPVSTTRQYAVDQSGGARVCTAPAPALADGKPAAGTMTVGNDGGWCGITLARGGEPYAAGLLQARPAHGKVYIHTVGDNTRIDYTPERGYVGPDSFSVQMLPGAAELRVAVTVAK